MSKKRVLLLVDDEAFNLALMELTLSSDNYDFVRASNGVEALKKLEEMNGCDAVILDRGMPEMDGIQLLKALKADSRFRAIPVVMQSATAGAGKTLEALNAGAFTCIIKPHDDDALVNAVRDAIQEAESLDTNG